ncbi:hypothetical protein Tco_0738166 [Tanacetum coccineum]
MLFAEFLKVYSGCSPRGTLRGLFVFPYRVPNIGSGMARGRLCIAHGEYFQGTQLYRSHGWRQLVSTIYVTGVSWIWDACWAGPTSYEWIGSCTKSSDLDDCLHNESKPLALPWGRTPRLDSGVRVREHVVRDMCVRVNLPCFSFIMATITSIKCVLTQERLDSVCIKYFVPEEVHPQLPGPDNTMHERPSGKVGMYTRFFDYANYRIPFSNFFVSVLVHFRNPFSQLSVFGSAKVSHFEIPCRVCNIEPSVSLFRYFYTHNYKNGWFGFTKRPNIRACYSKNLDSVKNWNDHFFWVDEFMVPANARFSWFSGSNIVKDKAPLTSEYNIEHVNTLITQASPFLRFPEEFLCWVGISHNYLLKKDTYPRFEYENGEEMDLNAFIRTTDPRKVRIVERPRTENEGPIVIVAKHRTVTLLPTSVSRPSREFSESIEREFGEDDSGGGGQEDASVAGHGNARPVVPITDDIVVEADVFGPKRPKKKMVIRGSEGTPTASHPPKRLKADYGRISGSTAGVTASPLEEGGDHTDSVTGPSLRSVSACCSGDD